jgi:glutamate-5-semialdehyde dehydrogenase
MLEAIGKKAKLAIKEILHFNTTIKNELLLQIANSLENNQDVIIKENKKDLTNALEKNFSKALVDRLLLDKQRIESMAKGLRSIVTLPDTIGNMSEINTRPNGLRIGKKTVPLGVIGIIYEARPNVTIDVFGLAFKSSNIVILRGGKEAIYSNMILVSLVRSVFIKNNYNPDIIQLITDTTRTSSIALMHMDKYLDVLIPRGGASLIQAVIKESTVPIIETGTGNCHIYVDKDANIQMDLDMVYNAKVRRPAVCNACETVVVHNDVKESFLTQLAVRFKDLVEIRGDKETLAIIKEANIATTEDYNTEYLDYIIAVKVVNSLNEAINHIERFSTKHSEAIITDNEESSQIFLNEIDAAAVYVNASTAFTDGAEFGLGAEVGISTQKLHARGPMGLKELTTIKYIIYGNGQVRP